MGCNWGTVSFPVASDGPDLAAGRSLPFRYSWHCRQDRFDAVNLPSEAVEGEPLAIVPLPVCAGFHASGGC